MTGLHDVAAGPCDPEPPSDGRVAAFRLPPLSADLHLEGWMTAQLWASCASAQFDVTAKLVKRTASGRRELLGDGIKRVSGPADCDAGSAAVDAGSMPVKTVTVEIGVTSAVIAAGETLTLEVAAGSFPRFDTAELPEPPPTLRLRVGPDYPSRLALPVSARAS
jgi:predicted acyl esterase